MFDFSEINIADKILSIFIAVIQAMLIALITKKFVDKAFQEQRLIGKNLQEYGIKKVSADKGGTLSKSARKVVFGLDGRLYPEKLDLCFISGHGFFRDYETKAGYLSDLVKNGCKIRVLLANPYRGKFKDWSEKKLSSPEYLDEIVDYYYSVVSNDIKAQCFLERSYAMLIKEKVLDENNSNKLSKEKLIKRLSFDPAVGDCCGDHIYQVKNIANMCKKINASAQKGGNIEIRFYEDEYQMPIIKATSFIDEKHYSRNEEMVLLWTNVNAPIKETSESINVFCSVNINDENNTTFISDVTKTFEYLWDLYDEKMTND